VNNKKIEGWEFAVWRFKTKLIELQIYPEVTVQYFPLK
jgi:hypothetical protein